jgi:fibronectin-binding autotransporter adhesin
MKSRNISVVTSSLLLLIGLLGFTASTQADVTIVSGSDTFSFVGDIGNGLATVPSTPTDIALASNGGTPFAISEYGGPHLISHLNDGNYGNSYSWITAGLSDARSVDLGGSYGTVNDSFAGVAIANAVTVSGFCFGRSNLGEYGDRIAGTMYLQYTTTSGTANVINTAPSADSIWTTFGSITTTDVYDHVFAFSTPISGMTGLRIVTQAGNCIDEIQVYGSSGASSSNTWTGGGSSPIWSSGNNWSSGTLGASAAITFAGSVGLSNTNDISGFAAGGITFDATAGAFTLSGNSLTLAGNVVNNSAAAQTINLNMALQNLSTTLNSGPGKLQINGVLSGSNGVNVSGAGTVVLAASNSYTGNTTVNSGTLEIASGGSLAGPATVNSTLQVDVGGNLLSGAPLAVNAGGTVILNTDQSIGHPQGSGGTIQLNGGHTLTVNMSADISWAGTITGDGNIVRAGGGFSPLRLSGPQSYTGSTTITGAYLVLVPNTPANLPTGTFVDIHAGGILDLGDHDTEIGGLTSGTANDANGQIYTYPGVRTPTLTINTPSGSPTYAGQIGGNLNNLSVVKAGAGTQVLSGSNNNYMGDTIINGGKLVINGGLPNSAVYVNVGGSLGGVGTVGQPVAVAGGPDATTRGGIDLVNNAVGTLTLSNPGSALSLGSDTDPSFLSFDLSSAATDSINLSAGNLLVNAGGVIVTINPYQTVKNGTYPLITFPPNSSSLVGNFTLDPASIAALGGDASLITTATAEVLRIGAPSPTVASWNGSTSANWNTKSNWTSDTGGVPGAITDVTFADVGAQHLTTNLDADFAINSLTFGDNVAASVTIASSGGHSLTIGVGGLTTTQNSGAHVISAPVVLGTTQTWTLNSVNSLAVSGPISGLSGSEGLTVAGTGLLVLAGSNTYSGATTVSGGTVELASGGRLAGPVIIDGTSQNSALQVDAGASLLGGLPVTLTGGATFVVGSNCSVSIQNNSSGTILLANDAVLTQQNNSGDWTFSGAITGSGGFTFAGPVYLRLTGGASYTGPTTVTGGILVLQSTNDTLGTSFLTVNSPGQVDLAAGTGNKTVTVGGLAGSGNIYCWGANTVDLQINQSSGTVTYGGVLYPANGGDINIIKSGAGTEIFTGVSTYGGSTTINGGKLVINGALPNSPVFVNGGGALGGAGTLGQPVLVAGGTDATAWGAIDLTNSASETLTLTSGGTALTLGGSDAGMTSVLAFDISSSSADSINLSAGSLLLNAGGAIIKINPLQGKPNDGIYSLISFGSGATLTGSFTLDPASIAALGGFASLISTPLAEELRIGNPSQFSWNGAASANWSNSGNWTSLAVGTPGPTADVAFADVGAKNLATDLDANFSINSLTFNDSTTGSVTIASSGGSTLTIGAGGLTTAPNTGAHVVSVPIVLSASQGWDINSANPFMVSGPISGLAGTESLTKAGSGVLVFAGSNTYTGATIVNGGTLELASGGSLGGPAVVNVNGTLQLDAGGSLLAGAPLTLNNGGTLILNRDLSIVNPPLGTGGKVQLNGGRTFTVNMTGDITWAGSITGNGNFVRAGGGFSPLRLSGPQSYTGSTTITGAYLVLVPGTTANLPTGTLVDIHAGGILDLGAHATEISGLSSGTASDTSGQIYSYPPGSPAALTINMPSGSQTYGGVIGTGTFNDISVVKAGLGTQVFIGGGSNYTGSTTISGGALQASDGAGLPTVSNLIFSGSLAQNGYGAVLQGSGSFTRALGTGAGQVQWTGDGGFSANGGTLIVSMSPGASLVWSNSGNSNGTPQFVGDGNVLTLGSRTANSQVIFTDGIDLNGETRQIDVAAGTGGDSALMSGNIVNGLAGTNAAGLLKSGAGTLILAGSNTYDGGTTVIAGTLILESTAALADGASLTVNANNAFPFNAVAGAGLPGGAVPVPEPSTLGLLAIAALSAGWRAWRRREA